MKWVEALEWYQEIAESALRYSAAKKGEQLVALIVELSNDAGRRANEALSESTPPTPKESEERKFTLEEALEIWEAGSNWYEDNDDFLRGLQATAIDRNKYFKEKFNIDL